MTTLKLRTADEQTMQSALEAVGLYDEETGYHLSSADHEIVILGPTPTGPLTTVDDGEGGTMQVRSMDERFHADLYDKTGQYVDALADITTHPTTPYHKIAGVE